jgi:LmbE family N-acetylglucosaminyl deacetylase
MTARTVLSVSPHPDDELIGAGATLMALRDAGWHVLNLACSLGRSADRERRLAELMQACLAARFELLVPDELPPIGRDDDLGRARRLLARAIGDAIGRSGAELLVGPSPHDAHHGHEVVGRAIRDAVESRAEPAHVMFWASWSDLQFPNVLVPFDAARLAEMRQALHAHAGELRRNRFDQLMESRSAAAAVLGPERVFGFGVQGAEHPYAELLTEVSWRPEQGWRLTEPSMLDPSRPIGHDEGPDVGWWLHAPSARSIISAER